MSQPVLIIIAGCNGAGKSTYSHALIERGLTPFDYDKRFKEIYDSLIDSELREEMAKNSTTQEFESSIEEAFSRAKDFCFETNFDSHPTHWAKRAKENGYRVELIFFCLESQELANERVAARTRRNGHFVSESQISYKWKQGYKNLNLHFRYFDHIVLVDNSSSENTLSFLFTISKQGNEITSTKFVEKLPDYSERRFPEIVKLLSNS